MKPLGVCIVLLLALPIVAADVESRAETRDYQIGTSECGLPSPNLSTHCFEIIPGETHLRVDITEESETRQLGWPILATLRYMGVDYPYWFTVCGGRDFTIVPGATGVRIDIEHGDRSGFCPEPILPPLVHEYSPAIYGDLHVTFS